MPILRLPLAPLPRGILLALALALALAGCYRSERAITVASAGQSIAVVNNERIAYEDFENTYQAFLTRWEGFIRNEPAKRQEIKELVLQQMIQDKLLAQEARRKGIALSDEELSSRIADLIAPMDQNELRQAALTNHTTVQQWTQAFQTRLVQQKLIQQEVIDKLRVTNQELRAYYDRNPRRFVRREQAKVRHLAVGSRDLYDKVMHQLERNEDFVALVKKYSITPDRAADGELGYVERGVLPQPLDQAIFELKRVGAVSPAKHPVQTEIGFHIFRIEGYRPEGMKTFEEAQPEIRARLIEERQTEAYRRWLEGLRRNATITIDQKLLGAEAG
jgi:parvulin-like peptidyl-prolyl isomerase